MRAGRDHVRLRQPVSGGRAAAGEVRYGVIAEGRRALVVDRANGENERVVTRFGDGACTRAKVRGGDDNDGAGLPRLFDCKVQQVGAVALPRVSAERQVDDRDVVGVLERHDPLQSSEHLADVRRTAGTGDLDGQDLRTGRRTDVLAAGSRAVTGNESGDECAVAELVVAGGRTGEVDARRLAVAVRTGDRPQVVGDIWHRCDAGVDERNRVALAVVAVGTELRGTDDLPIH